LYIKELWRFPVKSMAGERLERARLTELGIEGDRNVLVVGANGRVLTSRTKYKLLGLRGTISAAGETLVSGHPWESQEAGELVKNAAGPGAELLHYEGPERFDILPLLVATDGAIAEFGEDGRRLRANIVVGGVEGLAERKWPGKTLRVGEVLIGIRDLRGRCVMTTFDPDTLEQEPKVLKEIVRKFGGELALNCFVMKGGVIEVGQEVELEEMAREKS
jgi:MOSC domain-containing protein